MNQKIENYLDQLKKSMEGQDSAIIQDALSDAQEHLTTALANQLETDPKTDEDTAAGALIEKYGDPAEIASAYADAEKLTSPTYTNTKTGKQSGIIKRFFGIFLDPLAWGGLFYMFISFITGIIYFTWAVTGISLSLGLLILIIGLPFALLFLLSVRGLALLEGRLVEALLGVRMPRRPVFVPAGEHWYQRITAMLSDKHTWFSLIYLILQFVLGTVYFVALVVLFAFAVAAFSIPVAQWAFHLPVYTVDGVAHFVPTVYLPLLILGGLLLLTATFHIAKFIGQLHGKYAKLMLVRD